MLGEADIHGRSAAASQALVRELRAGAGFAVVTEEGCAAADLHGLAAFLEGQQEWSDFPFILLTSAAAVWSATPRRGVSSALGNVTFLERPFHPTTLVSLARAALRARRRQYDAREPPRGNTRRRAGVAEPLPRS